jgi:ankyrin repeat protein
MTRIVRAVVDGDRTRVVSLLDASPELARECLAEHVGEEYFLKEIRHQVYAGDTVLHLAAACYASEIVVALVGAGASVAAVNRRGAQPLHYAVDGGPGNPRWSPVAQRETVRCLLELGADPNAVDKNGTSPLHRAVRNRCAGAVSELIEGGADLQAANGSGSTSVELARWTTGRGGSGSPEAREQQQEILRILQAPSAA